MSAAMAEAERTVWRRPAPKPHIGSEKAVSDVIVVGAGPAGATLATLLARAGADVLLLDRATFPRAKPCAEYMSPGVVRLLHELGVAERIEAAGARLRGFVVTAGGACMRGTFGRARGWEGAPPYGLGVTRTVMDAVLVETAREAGATVREGVRVTDVLRGGGRVVGVWARTADGPAELRAPLVVGADGVRGVVGRRLGMVALREGMRRLALVAHLAGLTGLGEFGEIHVGPAGYCGVAPLGDDLANVAMVLRPGVARLAAGRPEACFRELLAGFGDLGRRAAGARLARPVMCVGPLSYRARALVTDGALLVGDAGGFYDPFTGQGVYRALRGAQLAAPVVLDALRAGEPSRARLLPYARARRREGRGPHAVEWLVQRFLDRPALLRRAVRRLGERPAMADALVGVTGDVLPARRVLAPAYLARLVV
jgi:geranylgeranyl reductase family protein